MASNYNKIITTVNSVTSDYTFLPDRDNVIVIDTSNNRIGINTVDPEHAIHVSGGTIKTTYLDLSNGYVKSNLIPEHDLSYSLGSTDNQWSDLFIGPGSIYMDKKKVFSISNDSLELSISGESLKLDSNLDVSGYITNSNNISQNIGISGNLIPETNNIYSLGDSTNQWKDLYVGPGSIYIDGQKILSKNTQTGNLDLIYTGTIQVPGAINFLNAAFPSGVADNSTNIGGGNIYNTEIGITSLGGPAREKAYFTFIDVQSDSSFNNSLYIGQNLTVNEDLSLNQNLYVGQDVSLNSNLFLEGDASFNNNVDISYLTVLNDASFNNIVDISSLTVLNDLSLNQNLYVGNDVSFNNNLFLFGDASFNNNVEISNNLIVNGDASFNNNVEISNNLIVNGDASFNNNVDISGDLIVENGIFKCNFEGVTNALPVEISGSENESYLGRSSENSFAFTNLGTHVRSTGSIYNIIDSNSTYDNTSFKILKDNIDLTGETLFEVNENGVVICDDIQPSGDGSIRIQSLNAIPNRNDVWIQIRWDHTDNQHNVAGNHGFWGNRAYQVSSDDRIKHHEKIITNGLDNIRKLNPKFYKKTNKIYAADYNGEVDSGYIYESGLIAQEILTINDLSHCVWGGDYYDESNNYVEELYAVSYSEIFVHHIAATKELDTIVNNQATTITELNNKITLLESENATMIAALNTLLVAAGQNTI